MTNIGIILACGLGTRFNSKIPKQIYKLKNKYMIEYSIMAMSKLDNIVIITNDLCYKKIKYLQFKYDKLDIICENTNDRHESIYKSIQYVKKYNPSNIIIHDSARPFINKHHIKKLLILSKKYKYIQYCMKLTNGLGFIENNKIIPVDRNIYIELCTPICINNRLFDLYNEHTIELFDIMNANNVKYKILYDSLFHLRKITYNTDI